MGKTARNQCELNISETAKAKKRETQKNQSEMFLEFRSQKGKKNPKTTERGQDLPHRRSKWSFLSKPG